MTFQSRYHVLTLSNESGKHRILALDRQVAHSILFTWHSDHLVVASSAIQRTKDRCKDFHRWQSGPVMLIQHADDAQRRQAYSRPGAACIVTATLGCSTIVLFRFLNMERVLQHSIALPIGRYRYLLALLDRRDTERRVHYRLCTVSRRYSLSLNIAVAGDKSRQEVASRRIRQLRMKSGCLRHHN